ncbi:glycosyltransferase [Arenibacter lacus]|uniref:glycosyltransferase n=1 Tax=Arenibacter lacus TaxID=2608629 RepID=UPI00123D07DA|nr:glycosyltransferase [Arenibacter lacus]
MKDKICALFNVASFYREPIYMILDKELKCDFYFGDKTHTPIKKMDYSVLSGFQKELKFIKLIGNFNWLQGTIKLLFKGYDTFILTGESYCLSNWLLLLYCNVTNKRIYMWTHGWSGRENRIKRIIKKQIYKLSTGVFLYGDYAKELMLSEGFSEQKLFPIYNSLDYNLHLKLRDKLKKTDVFNSYFKNDNPTLIYVGRLQKAKRIDLIFEAISLLKKENVYVNFIVVGGKSDIDFTEKDLKEWNIAKQVWFYGPCYDETILAELFYNAEVCVSPGNVGLTAVHSLSFGTPVITHKNFKNQGPEFEVITEGKTGSFFDENNVDDLANKIKHYTNMDESQKSEIKSNCYNVIDERYNPHYQLSVIKRVLNAKPSLK